MARLSSSLPSIRILVLGDSGVGKTSLLLSLASPTTPLATPLPLPTTPAVLLASVRSTIGCCPHTLLLAGVGFVELMDVGGHRKYAMARSTFYGGVDGLLLVYDCSNGKSYTHISRWIAELLQHNSTANGATTASSHDHDDDHRQAASAALSSLPVLAVGTKSDLMDGKAGLFDSMRDYGLDMVTVSAKSGGDSTLHALLPFFHRVFERKAEHAAIGYSKSNHNHNSRKLSTTSSTAAAIHHRKIATTANRLTTPNHRTSTAYGNGHHSHSPYDDDSREGGWDAGGLVGGADGEERAEDGEDGEEDVDGGLTIDMNQLDMLSAYNAVNGMSSGSSRFPSSSSSSSSPPSSSSRMLLSTPSSSASSSSARHVSPLSRLLPSGLFGLGGSGKKEDKQARSRV